MFHQFIWTKVPKPIIYEFWKKFLSIMGEEKITDWEVTKTWKRKAKNSAMKKRIDASQDTENIVIPIEARRVQYRLSQAVHGFSLGTERFNKVVPRCIN